MIEAIEAERPRAGRWRLLGPGIALALVALLGVLVARHLHAASNTPPRGPGGGAPGAARGGPGGFGGAGAPLTVGVGKVVSGDVPVTVDALGTVTPLATVTVRAQVNGVLTKLAFKEGQMVAAGDVLAQLDAGPFRAALDQVRANLQRDQAQLTNAQVDLKRYSDLLKQDSVSQQQYDTQAALVRQLEAAVASDRAASEAAQLNLDYCRIRSPVAGRVGLRQLDVGNLVQAGAATGLVVVTQLQPITVLFSLPEDVIGDVTRHMAGGTPLSVDLYDRAQAHKLSTGRLVATDNEIDPTTGTLKLRASFDNADLALVPNQFVNVRLLLETQHDRKLVPGAALQQGSAGTYVYVVNDDHSVAMRAVKTGPVAAERVAIDDGLALGETVVVDGADQLRDGARVTIAPGGGYGGKPGGGWGGKHLGPDGKPRGNWPSRKDRGAPAE